MNNIQLADKLTDVYGWSDEEREYHLGVYNRERPIVDKPIVNVKRMNIHVDNGIDISKTWATSSPCERGGHSQVTCGSIKHKRAKVI